VVNNDTLQSRIEIAKDSIKTPSTAVAIRNRRPRASLRIVNRGWIPEVEHLGSMQREVTNHLIPVALISGISDLTARPRPVGERNPWLQW
jgi:hypothetical protein